MIKIIAIGLRVSLIIANYFDFLVNYSKRSHFEVLRVKDGYLKVSINYSVP